MLISLSHRFVFLCNRKCASVSIESMLRRHSELSFLGPPEFRHTNYRHYRRYIAPYIQEVFGNAKLETVCIVREPLSWLYSFYRFRSRYALRDPGNPDHCNSTAGISFPEFVAAYLQEEPPPYADVGCQFDFVRDERNRVAVDRIFPYDRIDRFVDYIGGKIGHPLRMGHKNLSPKKNRRVRAATLLDRAVKAATGVFNLRRVASVPAAVPPLPDELLEALDEHLQADIALYERAIGRRAPSSGDGVKLRLAGDSGLR